MLVSLMNEANDDQVVSTNEETYQMSVDQTVVRGKIKNSFYTDS